MSEDILPPTYPHNREGLIKYAEQEVAKRQTCRPVHVPFGDFLRTDRVSDSLWIISEVKADPGD